MFANGVYLRTGQIIGYKSRRHILILRMASCMIQRERPKVGVGVFVMSSKHPNCVLVGRRKGLHGAGKYALPGGHLEFGESWEECGQREVEEETGMRLVGIRYSTVVNAVVPTENYHYITLFVQGHVDLQHMADPTNLEPDKCEGWNWVDWDRFLPLEDLFEPLRLVRLQGYNPFTVQTSLHLV